MSNGRIAALAMIAAGILATPALAAGDPVQGKAVFARCAICHNVEKDGGNGVGPNLFGIAGRKAASVRRGKTGGGQGRHLGLEDVVQAEELREARAAARRRWSGT